MFHASIGFPQCLPANQKEAWSGVSPIDRLDTSTLREKILTTEWRSGLRVGEIPAKLGSQLLSSGESLISGALSSVRTWSGATLINRLDSEWGKSKQRSGDPAWTWQRETIWSSSVCRSNEGSYRLVFVFSSGKNSISETSNEDSKRVKSLQQSKDSEWGKS